MAANNPYERLLRADTAQAMRQSMQQAADLNPDTEAKLQGLARQYGVPVDAVRLEQPAMERRAKIDAIDYDRLAREAPATSNLMADPKRAAIAHDDLDSLHGAENVLKSWQGPKPSFASVASGFAETLKYKPLVAGMRLWMNDLMFGAGSTPEDQVRRADLVRKAGQAQAQQDYSTPAFESATASGVYSGGVSILQNLPGLAASIATGSPAPGLAMAGLNSAAPAYGKYAARGATIGESAGGALAEGAVEVATEALPMGFLVKNFGRVGAGKFIAGMLGREIPSEQVATLVQDLVDSAVANPDKTWQQYIDERPDAAYKTLIATITQGGVMGAASKIAQVASGRAEQAQMAEEQASRIEAFNQFAAASKVMQRDPQTFETFIAKASEGAPVEAVFIDAQALLQSGVADQVAAASPSVAAQIAEAAQTGGTIAIPVEEYAARIAPTEAAGALLDHLRTTPDGFSRAEAQAYMQEQAPELEREVQRIITEKAQDESFKASAGVVKDIMRQQLDQVGRFTPEARDSYATVVGNFYAVQAAKLGVTPDALYKRYPLTVTAEEIGGNALDQGNVSAYVTDEIDDLTGLPLNSDGTVTVYHHTSAEKAEAIRTSSTLKSAAEPDVYVTTRKETDTGYGDVAVPVRVKPDLLQIDDEFPDGRVDYRIDAKRPGGSVKVRVGEVETARPDAYNQGPAGDVEAGGENLARAKEQGWDINNPMYHNSSREFDRFDLSRVGSSSGAFTEGWGFYFADSHDNSRRFGNLAYKIIPPGYFFDRVLYFEKPFDEQLPYIKETLKEYGDLRDQFGRQLTGWGVYQKIVSESRNSQRATSQYLARLGIYGAVFDSSRDLNSNEGARDNYVVWDQSTLDDFRSYDAPFLDSQFEDKSLNGSPRAVPNWAVKGKKKVNPWAPSKQKMAQRGKTAKIPNEPTPSSTPDAYNQGQAGQIPDTITIDGVERPTTNSTGKPIHPTEEGVRKFWEWFGGSKAVDKDGKPLVVYHGTTADVSAFDPGFSGSDGVGYSAPAFFATDDTTLASDYASSKLNRNIADAMRAMQKWKNENPGDYGDEYEARYDAVKAAFATVKDGREQGGGANVMPLYMSLKNPLEVDAKGQRFMAVMPTAVADAVANGYDGAIVRNVIDNASPATNYPATVYFVLKPEQIKSATGNRGTFDPSDANILHQGPRGAEIEVDGVMRPALNSKGQPIHPTEEGLRKFWEWFGDGAFVDEAGRPIVFFHSTLEDKAAFDKYGLFMGYTGVSGISVTDNPEMASRYLDRFGNFRFDGKAFEKNVMAVYINASKPLYRQEPFKTNLRLGAPLPKGYVSEVEKLGYDALVREDAISRKGAVKHSDAKNAIRGKEIVIFNPAGIKSAIGNAGAFDPSDANILHQGPRGAFTPDRWNIALLKGADLSTFLHETGHAFLEMQFDMAGKLQAIDELTEGERGLLSDADALLSWFGLRDLSEWQSLDFEERRHHHEKFARGFEAYLFEGKAPSIELQGLFQRFRAWLVNIYRDIKALNVELTDEVRSVMDRMIATGEQIKLAEMGRSMMPLFETAEQAGMTADEFAAYQALGVQSTADAIEDLQARGLRDLQWIRNARGREIKRLQREAGVQRAQIRMEARREVMSQPVYRAWQFLTGKISEADKLPEPERFKSDPDIVDPGLDSLFVAVAKLGGINRESAAGLWGVKPEDKPQSGLFGKPVLRADGKGWTVDQMAEKLAELGYLSPDENGNTALRDFEEAFQAELGGSPAYSSQADYDLLRANDVRPGDQVANVDALTAGRLDAAGLSDIAPPAEVVAAVKARRMTAANGLHPDIVADIFGFTSGDELVRTLAAANPPKEEIEALTDQRMLERFGELATPEAIERAADVAIHNAARGRMLATEANALAKAAGQRKILTEAAREYAEKMIARLKVRDIRPSQYASAEARAGRAAKKASAAGDLEAAAAEKRNELVNHYAARAAYDAQDEVRATLRNFSEFANRPDKRLGKTYDLDIANAARAILGEYGIAEKRAKKAGEYLKAVESYDPELYGVLQAGLEAAEANAKPVQEMTVEEVRGLRDEIDAMLHLARRSRQMEVDGDLMDREDVENALFARLEEIGIPDTIPGEGQAVTPEEARRAKLRTFVASARRVESWVGSMDGSVSMGPFRRFVFSRIKDAADSYRADKAAYLNRFRGLFDGIAPTLKPQLIAAPELGYTFGKDSGGSAMNEILHALLHTGNSSNKRKLLLGRGWAQQLPDGTLDTSRWDAFLRRMIVEEKITKAHFDFAQGVWDLLEDTKAGAQRTHRDVFGRYFDEVTAEPVKTPWGEYRGGYVPAMADARVVQDANLRALAEEDNAAMAYAFPTTPKGFTKARVEYNRPLTLDLRTLAQHIDKVLLFTHMEMPVRDVQRVMSKKVGQALARVDPEAIPAMIQPWLNRAAKQQVETPIAGSAGLMRFFSVMRARAGAAAMFANVSNAAQQVTGFALAAVKVRPGLMLSAAAEYIKAPRETARAVAESSAYMASRMDNEVSVMNGEINDILLNPSLLEQGQNWTMRHAYFLQAAVDNVTGPIIWTAAYNQALEAGEAERDAVRLADSAIRETQGSSLPEDISRIEGGNAFVRLFTQFAGYFNMQANLVGGEFVKIARDGGLRQNAGRGLYVLGLGFLAPAIVAEAIAQAFRGGPDDADKDGEYLDDWIAAVFGWGPLRNITAMVPVVGQGVSAIINAANSKPYDDRLATSPAVSMLESAARAPFSAYKALAEDGSGQKAVRDVATLISMTVGLPANLAARTVGYLTGVAEGRIDPLGPVDAVRGTITGAASPESKR